MKKLLALVLALVMSMSLVTISNADFKDADKIDYNEAVDVMNAVGVFVGDEKGNFNAKENLTREQAAKIIAYLELGSKAADAMVGGNTFTDVASSRWSAGFIAYCAQAGIVSGVGDGKFAPAGQLTALQFGKMLLVELGYDAKAEKMVGTDWAINTSKLMATAKLLDGIDGSVNQVLTREKAAQMTLNAIKAPMVTYETKGSSISVNGAEINFGASVAKYETSTIAKDQNISTQKLTSGEYTVELGEKLYKDLKKLSTTDAFERSATEWKLKAESIGVYADDADLVYYKGTKIGDIYADLGLSKGVSKDKVTLYVNGVKENYKSGTDYGVNLDIVKGSQKKIGGNGTELDVYYDTDTDSITFVVINTYVAKVASAFKATSTKDAYVSLNVSDRGFTAPDNFVNDFDTDAFAKDDIVAYTYSNKTGDKGIQSMYLAEKVTGAMSAYTTDGSVTVASTKISASEKSATKIAQFSQTVDKGTDVTAYKDANGYVLYVDADTSAEYAVVLAYAQGARLDSARVKLLFADGTTKKVDVEKIEKWNTSTSKYEEVTLNESAVGTVVPGPAGAVNEYDLVSYTVNSDGEYSLKLVADAKTVTAGADDTKLIENGKTALTAALKNADRSVYDTATKINYADGKTIFLVKNIKTVNGVAKTTYSVYEGIANVPSATIPDNGDSTTVTIFRKNNADTIAATIIFLVNNDDVKMSSGSKDVIFVKGNTDGVSYTKDLGYFYEYTAYVNGEETTIKVDENHRITAKSLIYGPQYDGKGILNGFDYADGMSKVVNGTENSAYNVGRDTVFCTVGTKAPANGVITLGNAAYAYAKDAKAYMVDVAGAVSEIAISSIADDTNNNVWFQLDDDGMIETLYVEIVDAPTSVDGETTANATATLESVSGTITLKVKNTSSTTSTAWSAQMQIKNTQTGLVTYVDMGSGNPIAAGVTDSAKTIAGNSINLYQAFVTINGVTIASNQVAG